MKKEIENKLIDCIGIENVKLEEPMEKHTTFRIGGPADYFLCPQTAEELKAVIHVCKETPYFILGNGSNLLVSDKGYRGAVIQIWKNMSEVSVEDETKIRAQAGAQLPAHKDYLGSLMGLELRREALGDIVLPADQPGTAYVFALEPAAQLICRELYQAGHTELTTTLLEPDDVPQFPAAQREIRSATVSSLRLDAVLSAMLRCSRGQASELIAAGRVEINHLPADKPHAVVYEGDVFTVRGRGRFSLTALPGKSKKDRLIIEFFQY